MSLPPEIKPTKKRRVIDLVEQAGLDVSDWSNFERGEKYRSSNPKYCYEWAFFQPGGPVVLCLWHEQMKLVDGAVEQSFTLFGEKGKQDADSPRKARREHMGQALAYAQDHSLPIQVIVVTDGKNRTAKGEADTKTVTARVLDSVPWAIKSYNRTSRSVVLRRGALPAKYVDQFSMPPPPDGSQGKHEVKGTANNRDAKVREFALNRAKGKCQLCGQPGFLMADGSMYLETHHVIPLSKGGKDSVGNIVAICPTHHREAHYGRESKAISERLLQLLESTKNEAH